MLIKSKGSPFYIFRQYATFSESSFFFKKVLRFLSLRYSADFRRSRLVFRQITDLTLYVALFVHCALDQKYLLFDFERVKAF